MIFDPKKLTGIVKDRQAADMQRRAGAARILEPSQLAGPGKKTAVGVLSTTLGGKVRAITSEDLRTFKASVDRLKGKLRGGITAAEAVAQSAPEDHDRCRKEIPTAVPFRLASGVVSFSTSASKGSDAVRHIVTMSFDGWAAAVASPGTPLQAAASLAQAPLRFECDCGKFTFWLRYVATIGGWVHGRPESGFPKIRNPELRGVCCKHSLRVMLELPSMAVRRQLARMIDTERKRLEGKTRKTVVTTTAKESKTLAQKQTANPRTVAALRRALAGRRPSHQITTTKPDDMRQAAEIVRGRLRQLKVSEVDIDQTIAAMLASGGR